MSAPLPSDRDLKNCSSPSSFSLERDHKGKAPFSREQKRALSEEGLLSYASSSWQRDSKGRSFATLPERHSLADPTAKSSRTETRPLSAVDQRIIAAILREQSPAESPDLRSLDQRIIKAISEKEVQISYLVGQEMVFGNVLAFSRFFFSSFPFLEDREVHGYLMGRIIDLTFRVSKSTPEPEFLRELCYDVTAKIQKYVDGKVGNLLKEIAALEGKKKRLGKLKQRIGAVREKAKSILKALDLSDTRLLFSEPDVAFIKRALLVTEKQQQDELYHAHAMSGSQTKEEQLCHVLALGDLYLQRSMKDRGKQLAVQAAGLYNYALRLAGKSANKHKLFHKLHETGRQLFALCTSSEVASYQSLDVFERSLKTNRQLLNKYREISQKCVKELGSDASPQEVRKVCGQISHTMKEFTRDLIHQCLEQLGPPPCQYAIIGLGSLAREEMTPRSDLEFAILLEKEEYRPYFRNLSYLLYFTVVNLGETILPCFNIPSLRETGFYDRLTPRGFSFDGEGGGVDKLGVATKGCKTPFGNRHTFHLIHTPERMAAFQGTNLQGKHWVEEEPHLPMELISHTLIIGEPKLVEEYRIALDRQLAQRYKKGTMRSYLATEHLYQGDDNRFDPSLYNTLKQGQLFEVKTDLYRLPHLLIDRLACFFELRSLNTLDRVDELQKRGVFQPKAANNLRELIAITTKMRLQTYLFHQKQKGTLNAVVYQFGFKQQRGQYILDQESLAGLQKAYQILLPFHERAHRFFRGHRQSLRTASFLDETPFTLGRIAMRLLQYEKAEHYYLLAKKKEPKNWPVFNSLGLVFIQLRKTKEAIELLEKAVKIAESTDPQERVHVAIATGNLAAAYGEGGQWKRALPLFQRVVDMDKEIYGERHSRFAIRCHNLAMAYKEAGQLSRAFPLFEQALEINKAIYGEQHPSVAIGFNDLGLAYQEGGQWKRALPLFERALEINKAVYGELHPWIAIVSNNLGTAYREGVQLERAEFFFRHALHVDRTIYGEKSTYVARDWSHIALVYQDRGQWKCALPLFERSLKIDELVYGPDHPDVGARLNNLALAYRQGGQHKRALPLFERSLKIAKATYGEQHPKVAVFMNNLALGYKGTGQWKRALPLLEKALDITEAVYDKRHPSVATRLSNLAMACHEAGQRKRALSLFERALEIDTAAYGENHPKVTTVLNNLAMAYKEAGQWKRALPLFERALEIDKATYGERHSNVAIVLNNLGLVYKEIGQLERAESFFQEALDIDKANYGEQHPSVAIVLSNVASLYKDSEPRRAQSLFQQALEIDKAAYGERHPRVTQDLNNLALAYQEGGQIERAFSLLKQALKIDQEMYGDSHSKIATDLSNLASLYKNSEPRRALILCKRALKMYKTVYGEEHPLVARSLGNLGMVYYNMGQPRDALSYLEQGAAMLERCYGKEHPLTKKFLSQISKIRFRSVLCISSEMKKLFFAFAVFGVAVYLAVYLPKSIGRSDAGTGDS